MNRYLVSVTTPDYLPKTGAYFNSLGLVTSASPCVVLMGFDEMTDPNGVLEKMLRETVHWAGYGKMPLPPSHSHKMAQHGVFLTALPEIKDDDLVCLTDLDIRIQRDFYSEEWGTLAALLRDNQIGVAYNATSSDRMAYEADRIGLSKMWQAANTKEGWADSTHCYNCGVMIARHSVFRRIQVEYETLCGEFYRNTPHRCRCQFLINYVWWRLGIEVILLPPQVHVHGHFRVKDTGDYIVAPGVNVRREILCHHDTPVIFRHAI